MRRSVVIESDDDIRGLVKRLSRPDAAGGQVIERAAILAEGADSAAVLAWIAAHAGRPEAIPPRRADRGLHGARGDAGRDAAGPPRRYVLPPEAFD